jgi:hypothetical protein
MTDFCNLRCPICYVTSGPEPVRHRDLSTIERMLDAVVVIETTARNSAKYRMAADPASQIFPYSRCRASTSDPTLDLDGEHADLTRSAAGKALMCCAGKGKNPPFPAVPLKTPTPCQRHEDACKKSTAFLEYCYFFKN